MAPLAAPLPQNLNLLGVIGVQHDGRTIQRLDGPAPLPLAWWQAAQLAAYTFPRGEHICNSPDLRRIVSLAAAFFFSSSTHAE